MRKPRSPFYVTTLIAGAFFMEMLDATIIATALPQMARSFHVGAVSLNIGMTAYMLTLAVFIPISGWVTDRFGSRSIFSTAIAVFTLSSVLCGASHTLTQFILARILQGVGGAMMVPVGRLIVLRTAPKEKLTQVLAYITWPGLSALVIGPPLGGFITTYFTWHWIFFLNLPVGVLALVLAMLWIENVRGDEVHPFDWMTFLLGGFASAGAVYAMEELGGDSGRWRFAGSILALSLLSGVAAVILARRHPAKSLIDFDSLRLKTYSLSVYGASAFRIAVGVLPFLLPLMFQIAFGLTAFQSGLYLLALFAGDLSMKAFVIQTLRRFGFRNLLIVNGVIVAASIAACATFSPSMPAWIIVTILFFHGASRSMEFTCLTTLAFSEIDSSRMSRANGFLSAVMQLSSGTGVAVGAITLRLVAHAGGHSAAVPQLRDFHLAFLLMAILALGPVVDSLGLAHNAGADTSGHGQAEMEAFL
ncbi:MAG: MFS transporter [Terracidiphilus sp.]|jgi:EmrB/QacA subfamily drug resistance transporter